MSLRVNTNVEAFNAHRNLSHTSVALSKSMEKLSSGLRINRAADDAAGLAISEGMRAQIRGTAQASRNAQDGISLVQTAEGELSEASNILTRMRELAIQSANGTLSTTDRVTIGTEVTQLISELDRIANSGEFNGISLLDGNATTTSIQVGINANETIDITLVDTTAATLGVGAIDVTSATGANAALTVIDTAVDTVNTARGNLGAVQNRLQSAVASIANARENLSAAESRIRDVDVAMETADLTRNSIMQQAAVSVLAQANVQPQIALKLLQ